MRGMHQGEDVAHSFLKKVRERVELVCGPMWVPSNGKSHYFVHILYRTPNKSKLVSRSKKGILVVCSEKSKGYRVWIPNKRRIEISRNVRFLEDGRVRVDEDSIDFLPEKENPQEWSELLEK